MNLTTAPHFRNVVVTGACGGRGQALARERTAQWSQVAPLGPNRSMLDELIALLPERCVVYAPGVSDSTTMQAVAKDRIGNHDLPDLVSPNVGVAGGFDAAPTALRRVLDCRPKAGHDQ